MPEALAATDAAGAAGRGALPGAARSKWSRASVAAVLPEANRDTRTLRLRIELPNPGQRLRAGMFAQVSLRGPQREALVVPAEAVIRTGKRALVYRGRAPGRYRPVEVQIGEQFDDCVVVRQGLAAGEQVVASGQFLIDSEASLQGVLARGARRAGRRSAGGLPARGVVVDVDADIVTLDHEPVPALKWPAMTMPFKLADRQLAKGLKKGQRSSSASSSRATTGR